MSKEYCNKDCKYLTTNRTYLNLWGDPGVVEYTAKCLAVNKEISTARRKFVVDPLDRSYQGEAEITARKFALNSASSKDCLDPQKKEVVE